jgi:hypothetical protein
MISNRSISDIISPWCKIKKGERWVTNQKDGNINSTDIRVKAKNKIVDGDSSSLAKCYEMMFQTLQIQEDRQYTDQDRRALWQLRLITHNKYETYCKVHWLICKVFELFVGLFTGHSYEKSYSQLVKEINRRLALGQQMTEFTPWIQIEIIDLKAELKTIKMNIKQLVRFILKRPELKDMIIREMTTNPDHIANPEFIKKELDTRDEINMRSTLTCEKINCQHQLKELLCLIQRNTEILDTFKKHVREMNQSNLLALQDNVSTPRIEEVD